jgi:hypothetical protein
MGVKTKRHPFMPRLHGADSFFEKLTVGQQIKNFVSLLRNSEVVRFEVLTVVLMKSYFL